MSIDLAPAEKPQENYGHEIPPGAAYFDVRVFALNYSAPVWFDDIEARALSDEELAMARAAVAAAKKAAAKQKARLDIKPRPPADLNAKWLVGWKGTPKVRDAADELARYINKVIGKPVSSVQWQPNQAKSVFVVTEAAHAPKEIAERLKGKRRVEAQTQPDIENSNPPRPGQLRNSARLHEPFNGLRERTTGGMIGLPMAGMFQRGATIARFYFLVSIRFHYEPFPISRYRWA